jgi:hypothetical protein
MMEKKTMMRDDGVEQRCNGHREGRQEKKKRKTREKSKEKAVTQGSVCRTVTQ